MKTASEDHQLEKKHYFRAIFDNSPDGVLFLERDVVIDCNESALKLLDMTRKEELTGLHPWDLSPARQPLGKNSKTLAQSYILQAKKKGNLQFDWTHKKPNGQEVPIEVLLTSVPVQKNKYLYAVWRDISVRKEAERALLKSEERYRLLVENANDMIFIIQDGKLVFHNLKTEEILGYSAKEIAVTPFIHLVHPSDRKMALDRYSKRLSGEPVESLYSLRIFKKNGEMLWGEINVVQIEWENKPATLNVFRDITRQKSLEQQLIQSQKMEAIGTLAGGIAHDFNNILTSIIGFTEMMLWKEQPKDVRRKYLEQILLASGRAKDLVRQILDFSRRTVQEFRPLETAAIIKEALKLLRPSLPSTIQIRTQISPEAGRIYANPVRIHQVMINLCTNAAQAMRKRGGILEVGLEAVNFKAGAPLPSSGMHPIVYQKLTIRDSGKGIDPSIVNRIFDPFFTTKAHKEGTGMGLSVVYGIVKELEGDIIVHSQSGRGTQVDVYLPQFTTKEESPLERSDAPPSKGRERILVVDDEPAILEMSREGLEYLGYRITTASTGPRALKIFRERPEDYDLILTDMTMPEMTGADLSRKIVRIRPDIPIILCTGYTDAITSKEAKRIGIREFIMKPLSIQELSAVIRRLLEGGSRYG